ncbi:MAG: ABC transporter ATP-binding protein [Bacteroidales bacterium]|nr:ABC transporter ATP-binding protein [Bacteroidales bacterium]
MSNPVIKGTHLCKNYGSVQAVRDVSFNVNEGEIFGFIGPDGAGKTSLFRMAATLLLPDSGNLEVCGLNVENDYKKIRRLLGYMPGKFSLYQDLTVEENLRFFASVFRTTVSQNYNLIRDIYEHIEPFKNRRAGKLSGGMKQKLALSCALIHRPRLLLLDEPTTGIDAVSRKEFWSLLRRLRDEGITVLVSTPYMDEASLCDRIALIQNGQILSTDTPDVVASAFEHQLFAVKARDMYLLINILETCPFVRSAFIFGQEVHVTINDYRNADEDKLVNYLSDKLADVVVYQTKPNIEDCFMELMSNKTKKG